MQWDRPLDEILGSRTKVRLIRALLRAQAPLSARALARAAGVSHTAAGAALRDLELQDVVLPVDTGSGIVTRLNDRHVLVGALVALFAAEADLDAELVRTILAIVPDACSIVVFGSAARLQDRATSDVDVLVVVPDGSDEDAIFDALAALDSGLTLGKDLGPVIWAKNTLRARAARDSSLLRSILNDGRTIHGTPLRSSLAEPA